MPAEGDGRGGSCSASRLKGHSELLSVAGSDCATGSGWMWCVLGILNVMPKAGWANGTFLADYPQTCL